MSSPYHLRIGARKFKIQCPRCRAILYVADYHSRRKLRLRKEGRCTTCSHKKDPDNYATCKRCREKAKVQSRNWRIKNASQQQRI